MNSAERIIASQLERMGFWVKTVPEPFDSVNTFYSQFPFRNYRLDFALPWAKIAIELDGAFWHGCASFSARQMMRKVRDRQRDKDLRVAGWKILRLSDQQLDAAARLLDGIWLLLDV